MTIETEFLYLDEAEDIPGLTKHKLTRLFKEKKIKLYLEAKELHLFCTRIFKKDTLPSITGAFSYSGILTTDYNLILDLVRKNQPIRAKNFLIVEPDKIYNWENKRPKAGFPNERFIKYAFTTKPQTQCTATVTFSSYARNRSFKQFSDTFFSALQEGERVKLESSSEFQSALFSAAKGFSKKLSYKTIEFYPGDLRFNKAEVLEVTNGKPLTNTKSLNPIEQIMERVIIDKGVLKVNEIWNIFKKEAQDDDNQRKYDLDNILYSVGTEELEYLKRGDKRQPVKYSTFKKYRTTVKRLLEKEGTIPK